MNPDYYFFRDLYDNLIKYSDSDMYPFHMPGHKRNKNLNNPSFQLDVTEIPPFDDLHHPQNIVSGFSKDDGSFLLVNGSTGGILAAIRTLTNPGDTVLIARNCHRSVYNAVELFGLKPHYIMPTVACEEGREQNFYGAVEADEVERMLKEYPETSLVVITSPTYEGMCSDTETIADICHAHGARLFVDQAHGVHRTISMVFNTTTNLFFSPPAEKADVVVTSLHKNLPALTQCAMLYSDLDRELTAELRANLAVFQTSSPSYLLMASAGKALQMMESRNPAYLYGIRLQGFYKEAEKLTKLKILYNKPFPEQYNFNDYKKLFENENQLHECGKILISTSVTDISGYELAELLREKYHIETEMAAPDYVLAYTSVCDTDEGFRRLTEALYEIDATIDLSSVDKPNYLIKTLPEQVFIPYEKYKHKTKRLLLEEAVGMISMETIMVYPPGIPCVVPGEVINSEIVEHIRYIQKLGGHVYFDSYRDYHVDTVIVADSN